jgi:hypothetical protein
VDITTAQLYTIDTATGIATIIGPIGFDDPIGLTFDSVSATLFATDIATDQLLTIDPDTGAGTAIGALGFNNIVELAFAAPVEVPEPSTLLIFAFGLSIFVTWTLRTRAVRPQRASRSGKTA